MDEERVFTLSWTSPEDKNKVILHKPNGEKLVLSQGDEISFRYYDKLVKATINRFTFDGEKQQPHGFVLTFPEGTSREIIKTYEMFDDHHLLLAVDTINSISKTSNKISIRETHLGGSRIKRSRQRKTLKKHKTLCKKYKQLTSTRRIKKNK